MAKFDLYSKVMNRKDSHSNTEKENPDISKFHDIMERIRAKKNRRDGKQKVTDVGKFAKKLKKGM